MLMICSRICSRRSAYCKYRGDKLKGFTDRPYPFRADDGAPRNECSCLPSSALPPTHSFALTDEQEQLCKEIRDFAAREIAPNVMRWDEASEFPLEVVQKLGAMGLMGVIFPVELGGDFIG